MAAQAPAPEDVSGGDVRSRIITAAVRLVAEQGSDAATTRAVAAAAAVQAPAIYRLFGDKDGLLDAVAEQTLINFVAEKSRSGPGADPVDDLRRGMRAFMAFGIANPDVFVIMYARLGRRTRAAEIGYAALRERVRRVALAGRLRVTEERAVDLCHGMARGTVLAMLDKPLAGREGMIEAASEAALAAVVNEPSSATNDGATGAASALRARLDDLPMLTPGERALMDELLERIAGKPRRAR